MADIFLSYAKEDREVARKLSTLLEGAGWTVWWDRRIPAGRTWRDVLEEALRSMRCMVVLWSSNSVESEWVKEEAEEAKALKKLVPVMVEGVNPPVGFRTIQAADLTDWDGVSESLGARQLISDLEALIGKPALKTAVTDPDARVSNRGNAEAPIRNVNAGATAPETTVQSDSNSGRETSFLFKPPWKFAAIAGVAMVITAGILWQWRAREPENEIATPIKAAESFETLETRKDAAKSEPGPEPASVQEPSQEYKIVKLAIKAPRQELKPAETLRLALQGEYSDGSESEITKGVEWSSSDPGVAAVNALGRVAAKKPGRTEITASHAGLTSSSWTLEVKAPEAKPPPAPKLIRLTVDANKKTLTPRERIDLNVTGSYSDGSEKELSGGVAWVSSDTSVASVNSEGELEALRAGKVEIVTRSDGVTSAPLRLVVKEPPKKIAVDSQEPKRPDPAPRKTPVEVKIAKETRPVEPRFTAEQLRAKIASYINRAKDFRVQGNYGAALAELATARATDPESAEVRSEIEQTRRACQAEKILGRKGLDC